MSLTARPSLTGHKRLAQETQQNYTDSLISKAVGEDSTLSTH